MSEELEIEVELLEDEIEIEEIAQKTSDVVHDEETQAIMKAEGLVEEPILEEPQPEVFVEHDQLSSLLESLLFASPKPLSFDVIKQVFKGTNVKTKDLRRALQEYAGSLANSQRGVYLEEVAGGYQLRTKLDNIEFLKTSTKQRPFKVSGPSMETLAIIAYKQPCIKAEVDSIRGVESGHLIRVLMDKGLVQFEGKSDLPGKPMLYKTTKKFLEVFGLRNIRELPSLEEIEQLIPEGISPVEDKKTLDQLTGELSMDYALRDMEAEDELNKISDKIGEIKTTSDYFEQEKVRQKDQKEKDRAEDVRERLLLGQYVEDVDMTWLKRYEQKQIEKVQAAEEAATLAAIPPVPLETSNFVDPIESADVETQNLETQSGVVNTESFSSEREAAESDASLADPDEHEILDSRATKTEFSMSSSATDFLSPEKIESIEELAATADVTETTIDFSEESRDTESVQVPVPAVEKIIEKAQITSENVTHVADKLSGLAGNALDAFKAFDDEEDLDIETEDAKNKIDI